jgi:hypothetical protein
MTGSGFKISPSELHKHPWKADWAAWHPARCSEPAAATFR